MSVVSIQHRLMSRANNCPVTEPSQAVLRVQLPEPLKPYAIAGTSTMIQERVSMMSKGHLPLRTRDTVNVIGTIRVSDMDKLLICCDVPGTLTGGTRKVTVGMRFPCIPDKWGIDL